MLAWMVYVVVVTVLLGAAAFAAEQSAQIRRAPTRWLWGASIIASLVLPTVISSVSIQIPNVTSVVDQAAPQAPVPLRQMTAVALQPSALLDSRVGRMAATPSVDTVLTRAWAAASALIFLGIAFNGAQLYRRKRAWTREAVAGAQVYVSEDTGPAVVGLLSPRIVVPRWIAEAAPETQALVMAHEQSHLDANDAQLLAIAILLIVTMPWNLPLWWQLRRLRFAIEMDCDARVLRGGHDLSRYGETLIAVGERQSSRMAVVAAMSESKSFLEQRIRKMLWKQKKYAWAATTAMAALGFVLAASAAEVSPPNAAPLSAQLLQTSASPAAAEIGGVQMKHYANSEWNFSLDIPARWNAFPAQPSNSAWEVVRITSNENGFHNLIVFRAPYDPQVSPKVNSDRVRDKLATAGFANFVTGETTIGSRPVRTLDFSKRAPDGKLWSCREFFIIDGTLIYTLGFGTTDQAGMFPLFDRMAKTFVFEGQTAVAASTGRSVDHAAPASEGRVPKASAGVAVRLVDDAPRAGDEHATGADGRDLWLAPDVLMTGAMFASVQPASDSAGQPAVNFTLTPEGKSRFAAITRENIGRRLAIVVNGRVVWAPIVRDEIAGGAGQINIRFSAEQAENMAREMNTAIAAR